MGERSIIYVCATRNAHPLSSWDCSFWYEVLKTRNWTSGEQSASDCDCFRNEIFRNYRPSPEQWRRINKSVWCEMTNDINRRQNVGRRDDTRPTSALSAHMAPDTLAYGLSSPWNWNCFRFLIRRKQMSDAYRRESVAVNSIGFGLDGRSTIESNTTRWYLRFLLKMRKCDAHRPNRIFSMVKEDNFSFFVVPIWCGGTPKPNLPNGKFVCIICTNFVYNFDSRSIYAPDAYMHWTWAK